MWLVGCSREMINKKFVVEVTIEAENNDHGRDVMDLNNAMLLLLDQDVISKKLIVTTLKICIVSLFFLFSFFSFFK